MRAVCGRKISTGTCAELEGHKSPCRTATEMKAYEESMAKHDPRNRRRS
jgi:hypothetical protein